MSVQIEGFYSADYPDWHEPTSDPKDGMFSLADMPDEWFDGTAQAPSTAPKPVLADSLVSPDEFNAWFGRCEKAELAARRRGFKAVSGVGIEVEVGADFSIGTSDDMAAENSVVEPEAQTGISRLEKKALKALKSVNVKNKEWYSAEQVQEMFSGAMQEVLRAEPYAKGMNTQVSAAEVAEADRVMAVRKAAEKQRFFD